MVIKNPMQLTIVRAVPFNSRGALCATSVEKSGESAMTTIPQKKRKPRYNEGASTLNINGEAKQQRHESNNAVTAIRLSPNF